jgi:hypothetical protein
VAPGDSGAEYGAGVIPSLMRVVSSAEGSGVVFDWVLSTWNPYGVVVMRTELAIAETSADVRPSQRTDDAVRTTLGAP